METEARSNLLCYYVSIFITSDVSTKVRERRWVCEGTSLVKMLQSYHFNNLESITDA